MASNKDPNGVSCCGCCSRGTCAVVMVTLLTLVLIPLWSVLWAQPPPPTSFGTGSMFDRISHRYDFINRALALGMDMSWRRTLVQQSLSHYKGDELKQVVDLATGTADVALVWAQQPEIVSSQVQILGLDPSVQMLEVGKQKVTQRELTHYITLQVGDARELPTPPDSVDIVTMAFGLRNVLERQEVYCQVHRILQKPHGIFGILEFSDPRGTDVLSQVAKFFIAYVVPTVGAVLSGAPQEYRHLQNSIAHFPSPTELIQEMTTPANNNETSPCAFRLLSVHPLNHDTVQVYILTPA